MKGHLARDLTGTTGLVITLILLPLMIILFGVNIWAGFGTAAVLIAWLLWTQRDLWL